MANMRLALLPGFAERVANSRQHWLHKGGVAVHVQLAELFDGARRGVLEDHLHGARAARENELGLAAEHEGRSREIAFHERASIDLDALAPETLLNDRPVVIFHLGSFRLERAAAVSTFGPDTPTEAEAA